MGRDVKFVFLVCFDEWDEFIGLECENGNEICVILDL